MKRMEALLIGILIATLTGLSYGATVTEGSNVTSVDYGPAKLDSDYQLKQKQGRRTTTVYPAGTTSSVRGGDTVNIVSTDICTNAANGIPCLDGAGKVPATQLPTSVVTSVGTIIAGSNVVLSKQTGTGTSTATGTVTSLASTDTGTVSATSDPVPIVCTGSMVCSGRTGVGTNTGTATGTGTYYATVGNPVSINSTDTRTNTISTTATGTTWVNRVATFDGAGGLSAIGAMDLTAAILQKYMYGSDGTYLGTFNIQSAGSNSGIQFQLRPLAGKSGWFSFTESGVADRWVFGTVGGDAKLHFATGNAGTHTDRMVLDAALAEFLTPVKLSGITGKGIGKVLYDIDGNGNIGEKTVLDASNTYNIRNGHFESTATGTGTITNTTTATSTFTATGTASGSASSSATSTAAALATQTVSGTASHTATGALNTATMTGLSSTFTVTATGAYIFVPTTITVTGVATSTVAITTTGTGTSTTTANGTSTVSGSAVGTYSVTATMPTTMSQTAPGTTTSSFTTSRTSTAATTGTATQSDAFPGTITVSNTGTATITASSATATSTGSGTGTSSRTTTATATGTVYQTATQSTWDNGLTIVPDAIDSKYMLKPLNHPGTAGWVLQSEGDENSSWYQLLAVDIGATPAITPITPGTNKTKVSYNANGLVTAGGNATAADVGAIPVPAGDCDTSTQCLTYAAGVASCVSKGGTGGTFTCSGSCSNGSWATFGSGSTLTNAPWNPDNPATGISAICMKPTFIQGRATSCGTATAADVGAIADTARITAQITPVAVTYSDRGLVTGAQTITPGWINAVATADFFTGGSDGPGTNKATDGTTTPLQVIATSAFTVPSGTHYIQANASTTVLVASTLCHTRLYIDSTGTGNTTDLEKYSTSSSYQSAPNTISKTSVSAGSHTVSLYVWSEQAGYQCTVQVGRSTLNFMVTPS